MVKWSIVPQTEDGKLKIICPECGKAAKPGQIVDYGIYDDMSLYFIRQCPCGCHHATLGDSSGSDTFQGEGKFKPLK